MIKKISLLLLISLTILHCFFNVESNDIEKTNLSISINKEIDDLYTSTTLKPVIDSSIVDINIPVRISFDDTDVLSHTIEVEGLIATPVSEGAMEYDIVSTEEYGIFSLYATYEDNVTVKSSVYTYSDGNTVYLSEASKENAFEKYLEQAILDEVYTLEEG